MALGVLARSGPSHGHHIRRIAEVTDVAEWGGVSVGALYRELRAMEHEGLVEATRTEKVGRRPERTVYAITPEGCLELSMLRDQAMRPLFAGPDPLGVALMFTGQEMDRGELRRILRTRRQMLAIGIEQITAERVRLLDRGHVDELSAAVMRRGIMTMEAEVRWHDELDAQLAGDDQDGADRCAAATGPAAGGFQITPGRRRALGVAIEAAEAAEAAGSQDQDIT
jgi:DNA-binding PadR family transcriptional regulator